MKRIYTTSLCALVGALTLVAAAASAQDDAASTPGDLPDIQGTWAQKLVTTGQTSAPVIGEVTSQTTTYQKMVIEQDADALRITETTCEVNIDSDQGAVDTIVPDRFVDSIEPVERRAQLRERDDGWYFFAPKTIKTLGVRLDDKDTDDLPDDADDPRVFDQDRDGNPGMTVRVEGLLDGNLYMLQRSWDELWGKVLENGQIAGRTTWDTDQIVLDKTGTLFGEVPGAKPHPDDKLSYFRMAPVDRGTSCADIAEAGEDLF